ncbi:LytR C-terminal domain-containing protein [Aeromicrobium wangtongii]|uniref:LytR C-terminal domain-containing protein n=1 Tax=Aeromicrobium wangtongii TaxID=2969247 RepID=UPI002017F36E|nr:LytR C-terminal domain-containing protein [Aeromicrobium wangtongii]MCL3817711.1 LytR C-terminal domain-containing protein [Aeromicrobium wangtongii]
MVAHRKNVTPGKGYVPSSWFIVLTVMVLIGGAGWLGWLVLDDDSSPSSSSPATAAPSAPVETSEPTKKPSKPAATPKPDQTPKPSQDTPAAPQRTARVSVLNNSGVVGAARAFSAKVAAAGWQISGVGNWTGSIPANTVYYPAGLEDQARLLASEVGIQRIRPSVAPMRMDRLTVILSGQQ